MLSLAQYDDVREEVSDNRKRLASLTYAEDKVLPGEEAQHIEGPPPLLFDPPNVYQPVLPADWHYQSQLPTWKSPGIYIDNQRIADVSQDTA